MVPNYQNFFVTYGNWQKLKEAYLEINILRYYCIVPTYLPIISFKTTSLKDSSPTEVDVELGSVLRIAQEVPAGTQTARWFVGDVRYILVHHTTATQPRVIPYLATTKIL